MMIKNTILIFISQVITVTANCPTIKPVLCTDFDALKIKCAMESGTNADDCFGKCKSQKNPPCQAYMFDNSTGSALCGVCSNTCPIESNSSQFVNTSAECFLYSADTMNITEMVAQIQEASTSQCKFMIII